MNEYDPDDQGLADIGAELERTIRATLSEHGVELEDPIGAAIIIDLLRVAGSHLAGDYGREMFDWADHVDAVNIGGRPLPRGVADPRARDPRIGANAGHGHVWERPDGMKARCGGRALCSECRADQALLDSNASPSSGRAPVWPQDRATDVTYGGEGR